METPKMYAPRKTSWVGVYEDYCVFVLVVTFTIYALILFSASLTPDYSLFVSTNTYNEHWAQLIAFGTAVPGIVRLTFKHYRIGGHTKNKEVGNA